ncbi:hypothetical protein EV426DRAFT_395650 [Tirmania nivea]|nr:hypothetical protein EV426DRAFT_395650 [Tirmania nivea]
MSQETRTPFSNIGPQGEGKHKARNHRNRVNSSLASTPSQAPADKFKISEQRKVGGSGNTSYLSSPQSDASRPQTKTSKKRSSEASGSGLDGSALHPSPSTEKVARKKPFVCSTDADVRKWIQHQRDYFEYMKNNLQLQVPTVTVTPSSYSAPNSSDQQSTFTSNSTRLSCEHCKKTGFKDKSKLQDHLRRHSDERPFVCSSSGCFKKYKYKRDLVNHAKLCVLKGRSQPSPQSELSAPGKEFQNRPIPQQLTIPTKTRLPTHPNISSPNPQYSSNPQDPRAQHTLQSQFHSPRNAKGNLTQHPSRFLPQVPDGHNYPLTGVGGDLVLLAQGGDSTQAAIPPPADAQIALGMGKNARQVFDSRSVQINRSIGSEALASLDQMQRKPDTHLASEAESTSRMFSREEESFNSTDRNGIQQRISSETEGESNLSDVQLPELEVESEFDEAYNLLRDSNLCTPID